MPGNPFKAPFGNKVPSAPTSRPDRPSVQLKTGPAVGSGSSKSAGTSGRAPSVRVTDKSRKPVSRPSPGTRTSGRGIQ